MISTIFLSLACAISARSSPVWAQSTATLKGMDVYRSETLTVEAVGKAAGPLIARYLRLRNSGTEKSFKFSEELRAEIEGKVRGLGKLAVASLYYGEYATSAEHTCYLTFDVVDEADAKARMAFRPAPTGRVKDPQGLLAAWRQYSDLGESLLAQGLITSDHPSCPAYYCLWGSATPELAALEKLFIEGAEPNKKLLLEVLDRDAEAQNRAAAVFVLSYLSDAKEVADIMQMALDDPGAEVRGAGLQVLSDVALFHKTVFLEPQKIIPMLDDPATSVRSRALGVLVALAGNPTYRPYVESRAAPYLLPLLKMEQPSVHDLAFTLLSMLSKETYGRRDYKAWESWISSQAAAGIAAPVPAPRKKR